MRAFCLDLHVEFRWGFLSSVRFRGSVLADVFRVTESEEGHRLVESDFGLPLLKNSGSTSAMGSVL